MKRYKRSIYINAEEEEVIELFAEQAGHSFSQYVRDAALSEGKRHLPKKRLRALIRDCIKEVLDNRIPV